MCQLNVMDILCNILRESYIFLEVSMISHGNWMTYTFTTLAYIFLLFRKINGQRLNKIHQEKFNVKKQHNKIYPNKNMTRNHQRRKTGMKPWILYIIINLLTKVFLQICKKITPLLINNNKMQILALVKWLMNREEKYFYIKKQKCLKTFRLINPNKINMFCYKHLPKQWKIL